MADTTITQEYMLAGIPRVIARSTAALSLTGTTTETTIATIAVAAGSLGPNGALDIPLIMSFTGSGSKTVNIKVNGTTFYTNAFTTSLGFRALLNITNTGSASNQIMVNGAYGIGVANVSPAFLRGSIDTSANALTITVTGTLATATETITVDHYLARLTYGA